MREWFLPPRFEGREEDARTAELIHAVLWGCLLGWAVYVVTALARDVSALLRPEIAASIVAFVLGLVALRRGHIRVTARVITGALLVTLVWAAATGGGVDSPANDVLHLVIVMAGFVVGWKAAILAAAVAFALQLGFHAGLADALFTGPAGNPETALAARSANYLILGALVALGARSVDRLAARLRAREQALRDSERRYTRMVHASPDAIVTLDGQGIVRECNPAVRQLVGREPEAFVGRHFLESGVIPEDERERSRQQFLELVSGGEATLVELELLHRDGHRVPIEANRRVTQDAQGEPEVQVIVRDITSRRESDAARAELERQLLDARRLEAIGRLAGGVAHDFNNLLTAILANGEILEHDTNLSSSQRRALSEVTHAARRASELTGQLLTFARRQSVTEVPLDIGAVVARSRRLLDRVTGETIEVRVEIADECPAVLADPSQIEQVLLNLVMNARDAMPDGGPVTVRVRPHQDDGAEFLLLEVSDAGVGMDQETLARVFEPFFTTRSEAGGTGLGLATVHGIVSQAGGHVSVESEPGEGTTFRALFPTTDQPVRTEDRTSASGVSHASQSVRILVVDDEPLVGRSVERILSTVGHEVVLESEPATALERFRVDPGGFDLLVTDVVMPHLTGTELAARIREHGPAVPVLYMSGYSDEVAVRHGVAPDGTSFIAKPFGPQELVDRVQAMVEPRA